MQDLTCAKADFCKIVKKFLKVKISRNLGHWGQAPGTQHLFLEPEMHPVSDDQINSMNIFACSASLVWQLVNC